MLLLIIYVLIALVFSFICSIAEAVLLSVNSAYISVLEEQNKKSGPILYQLTADIQQPLAAILTLNTFAHTMGAAGAGAQAAIIFGSNSVGIFSALLTLLILFFSEIIPKTLGAHHWRTLAPITAYILRFLIFILYPLVRLSRVLTQGLVDEPRLDGYSREELSAMAEVSAQEGQIEQKESDMLKSLLRLKKTFVEDAMTPQSVVFSLPDTLRVEEFFHKYDNMRFSRIPIFTGDQKHMTGFVLRSDLLLAQARGNGETLLNNYSRKLSVVHSATPLTLAFDELLRLRAHILMVVDNYGHMEGILSLEDVLETLLGLEIMDESDEVEDMQKLARKLWRKRAKEMGLDIDDKGDL